MIVPNDGLSREETAVRKSMIGRAAALASLCAWAVPQVGWSATFEMVNAASQVITAAYAAPAGEESVYADYPVLTGQLGPNGATVVRLPRQEVCAFNLLVMFRSGVLVSRAGVNLCATPRVRVGDHGIETH